MMELSFVLLLAIFVLGLILLNSYWYRWSRWAQLLNRIPGPNVLPILGNTHQFCVSADEIWPLIEKYNDAYYPIWKIYFLHLTIVHLLQPSHIEVLLTSTKHVEKSTFYQTLESWLGLGLLTSSSNKWRNRRRMLTPAFHMNVLRKYCEVMIEHVAKVCDTLRAKNGEVVELEPFFSKVALSVICETAMGTSFENIDPKEVEKYRESLFYLCKTSVERLLKPWLLKTWVFCMFTKQGWDHRKNVNILRDFSTKIIRERKKYHSQSGGIYLKKFAQLNDNNDENWNEKQPSSYKEKRLAMLDLLIAAEKDGLIDENGIREEVDTFIFEGHDTSSAAMCHGIQLFAEHTEIQARAREEVKEMFRSCEGNVTMDEINKLPYLEQCVKEILRLYPSVPFVARELQEDLILKDNITIPSGTIINLYLYDLHRNPQLWPDPHKFDPDRFLPEPSSERHPFSYIPFLAGPRNCIGKKFAMLELKILFAYILENFYLQSMSKHSEFVRKADVILRGQKQTRVKFIPIERN